MDQKLMRVQQLENYIREVCKTEPPSPGTPANAGYSSEGQGGDPFSQVMALSNNHHRGEKLYPAISLSEENGFGQQQAVMLNADEKINELTSLLEMQEQENDQLREQLDAGRSNEDNTSKESEVVDTLKNQLELNQQEKQAYFMISNDI